MKRRDLVKGAVVAGAGIALQPLRALGEPARPNVLVILVDQMRRPRFTPLCRTPNIDRIAARGVSFTNHFNAAVACSPSRACLLTGTYTIQNGVYQNVDWLFPGQPDLDPSIPTIGHVFKQAGYMTPYHGKWHLTHVRRLPRKNMLGRYGFDDWKRSDASGGGGAYCGQLQDPLYTRRVVEWLQDPDHRRGPWIMVCSLVNPHDICEYPRSYPQARFRPIRTEAPPPSYTDDLSTKPGAQRAWRKSYNQLFGRVDADSPEAWRRYLDFYIRCIEEVDRHVGQVLDALESSGQGNNTIVVFTSDHGEMAGSHQLRAKGPFAYEEIINTPLIVSWPGVLPGGVTTDAMAGNVDVLPTLASLTGVRQLPYQAGVDLSSALRDPAAAGPRDHVIYHMGASPEAGPGEKLMKAPSHVHALRTREWKYVLYDSPVFEREEELYNLKDDPLEMDNLAAAAGYRARAGEFKDMLSQEEGRLRKEYGS